MAAGRDMDLFAAISGYSSSQQRECSEIGQDCPRWEADPAWAMTWPTEWGMHGIQTPQDVVRRGLYNAHQESNSHVGPRPLDRRPDEGR